MTLENTDFSLKAKAYKYFATFDQLRNKNTFFYIYRNPDDHFQPCP